MIKELLQKTREYLDYVERHINNVEKAWELIQEKCDGKDFEFLNDEYAFAMINHDVVNHDMSKLSKEEFIQYRQFFFPTSNETKDKKLFDDAWENHKKHNLHHWQSWTKLLNNNPTTKQKKYKYVYVVTMVIDWTAMGFEFGDTAKSYYESNKEKIDIPKWAEDYMYKIFDCIY